MYVECVLLFGTVLSDVNKNFYTPYSGFSGGYGLPAQFNSDNASTYPMQCFSDPLFSGSDAADDVDLLPRASSSDCSARLYSGTKLHVENLFPLPSNFDTVNLTSPSGGVEQLGGVADGAPAVETDVTGQCICGSEAPEITGQRLTGSAATSNGQIETNGVCDRVEIGWAWPAGSALDTECDDPSQRDDRCLNPIVLGLYSRKPKKIPAGSSSLGGFTTGDDNQVDDFRKDGAWAFITQTATPRSESVVDGFLTVDSECGTVYEDPLAGDSTGQGNAGDAPQGFRLPSAVPAGLYCDAAGGRGGQLNLGTESGPPLTPAPPPPLPSSTAAPPAPPGDGGEEGADESRRRWYSQARTEGSNFDRGAAFSSRPSERGWTGLDVENMARFDVDCHCRGGLLQAMFSHAGIFLDDPISTLFPHLSNFAGNIDDATALEAYFQNQLAPAVLSSAYTNYVYNALRYTTVADIVTAFDEKVQSLGPLFSEDDSISALLSGSSGRKLKGCSESMVLAGMLHVFLMLVKDHWQSIVSIQNSLQSNDHFKVQLALMQAAVEPQSDCSQCGAGNAFYGNHETVDFFATTTVDTTPKINLFFPSSQFSGTNPNIQEFATLFGNPAIDPDDLVEPLMSNPSGYNPATDFDHIKEFAEKIFSNLESKSGSDLQSLMDSAAMSPNPSLWKTKPMQSFSQLLKPIRNESSTDATPQPPPTPQGVLSVIMNSLALYIRSAVYSQDNTLLQSIMSSIQGLQDGLDKSIDSDEWATNALGNGVCQAQDFMNNPFFFGTTVPYAKFQNHYQPQMPVVGGFCSNDCPVDCRSDRSQSDPPSFYWNVPQDAKSDDLGYYGFFFTVPFTCTTTQNPYAICHDLDVLNWFQSGQAIPQYGPPRMQLTGDGPSFTAIPRAAGDDPNILFYLQAPTGVKIPEGVPCCSQVTITDADSSSPQSLIPIYLKSQQASYPNQCYWETSQQVVDVVFGSAILNNDEPSTLYTNPIGYHYTCVYGGCGDTGFPCCSDAHHNTANCANGHRCSAGNEIYVNLPKITCDSCPTVAEVQKKFPNNHFSRSCQLFSEVGRDAGLESTGECFPNKHPPDFCGACGIYSESLHDSVTVEAGDLVPDRVNEYFACLADGCRGPDDENVDAEDISCTKAAPFGYLASQRASIFSPASEPPFEDAASSQPSDNANTCGRRDLFEQLATPVRVLDLNEALAVQDRPWWSDFRPPVDQGGTGDLDSVGSDGSGQQESADAWRQTGNQLASTGTFPWLTGSVCAGDEADPSFFNKSTLALIYGGYGPQCTRNQPTLAEQAANTGQARSTNFVGEGCPYGFQQTYLGSQFALYQHGSVKQSKLFSSTFANSETIRHCSADWYEGFFSSDLNVPRLLCGAVPTTTLTPFMQDMTQSSSGSSSSSSSFRAGDYECHSFGQYLSQKHEYYRTIGEFVGRHIFGLAGAGSLYPTPQLGSAHNVKDFLEASANVSGITDGDFVPTASRLHQVVGNFARHPYRVVPPPPSPPPPPGISCAVTHGATAAHQITAGNFGNGLDENAFFPTGLLRAGLSYTDYRDDPDNGVVYRTSADWASDTTPDTSGPFQMCVTYMNFPSLNYNLLGHEPPNLLFYGLPFTLAPVSSADNVKIQEGCYVKMATSNNANSEFLLPYYEYSKIVFCVCYSSNCTDHLNPGILNAALNNNWSTYSENYQRIYLTLNSRGFGTATPHYVPVNLSTFASALVPAITVQGYPETTSEPFRVAYSSVNYHLLLRFTETKSASITACDNIVLTSFEQNLTQYECCCGLASPTCTEIPANQTCSAYCETAFPGGDPNDPTTGLECSYSAANFGTALTSHECFWDRSTLRSLGVDDEDEAIESFEAWCPGTCFGERVSSGVPLWASTSWCGPNPGTVYNESLDQLTSYTGGNVLFPGAKYTFGYGLGERQQNIFSPDFTQQPITNTNVFAFTTTFEELGLHTQPSFLHHGATATVSAEANNFLHGRTIEAITKWTTNGDFGANHPAACWYSRRGIVNDMTDTLFGVCPAEQRQGDKYSCWWTAWPGTSRSLLGCSDPGVATWTPMVLSSDSNETVSPMSVFIDPLASSASTQKNLFISDENGEVMATVKCYYRGPGGTSSLSNVEQVACSWTFEAAEADNEVARVPTNAPAWWSGTLDSSRDSTKLRIGIFNQPPTKVQVVNSTVINADSAPTCGSVARALCGGKENMMGLVNTLFSDEHKTIPTDLIESTEENFFVVSMFNCTSTDYDELGDRPLERFKHLCAPQLCDVGVGRYIQRIRIPRASGSNIKTTLNICGDNPEQGGPHHLDLVDHLASKEASLYNFTSGEYENVTETTTITLPSYRKDCAEAYDSTDPDNFGNLAGTLVGVEMRSVPTHVSVGAPDASNSFSTTAASSTPAAGTTPRAVSQPGRAHQNGESVTFYSSLVSNNFYPPAAYSDQLATGWDVLITPTKSGDGDTLAHTYAVCSTGSGPPIIPWFSGGHTAMFKNPSNKITIAGANTTNPTCTEPDDTAAQSCIFTPVFSAGVFSTLSTEPGSPHRVVRRGGGRQTDASMCVAAPFAAAVNNEDTDASIEAVASVEFPGWLADAPLGTNVANLDAPPVSLSEAGLNDWCGVAKTPTDCNLAEAGNSSDAESGALYGNVGTTSGSGDGIDLVSQYDKLPRRHRICEWLSQTASQPDRNVGKFVTPDIDVTGGDSDDPLTSEKIQFKGQCVLSRKTVAAIGSADDGFSEQSVYAPRCAEVLLAFGNQIPISACGGGTAGFTGCVPTLTTIGTTIRSSGDSGTGLFSTTFPGSSTQAQLDVDPENPSPLQPSSLRFATATGAYFTVRVDTTEWHDENAPTDSTTLFHKGNFLFSYMDCVGCYESASTTLPSNTSGGSLLPTLPESNCSFVNPTFTKELTGSQVDFISINMLCTFADPVSVLKFIEFDTDQSSTRAGYRHFECLADNETDTSRCSNEGEVSHMYATITSLSVPPKTVGDNTFKIVASKFLGFQTLSSDAQPPPGFGTGPPFLTDRSLLTCVPITTRVRVDPSTTNFLVSVGNIKRDFPVDCSRLAALHPTVLQEQYGLNSLPDSCTMAFMLPLNASANSGGLSKPVYHELFDTTPVVDSSSGQIQMSLHDTLQDIGLVSSVGKLSGWHRMLGLYRRTNRGVHWMSDLADGSVTTDDFVFPDIESFAGKSLYNEIMINVLKSADASAGSLYRVPNCRRVDDPSSCYVMMDKKAYYPCSKADLAPTPTVTCTKPTFQYMFPEGTSGLQYNIPLSLCRKGPSCGPPSISDDSDSDENYGATIGAWTLGATGVHYCDNYLDMVPEYGSSPPPASSKPDNFYFYNNSMPVHCSGDPYDTTSRIQFCQNQKPWYVLGGFVLNEFGIEQLCPWLAVVNGGPVPQTQECFIFPDGRYNSISLILSVTLPKGLTFSGTTFRYVPFSQAALRRLLVSARVYNTMFSLELVERVSKPLSESEQLDTGFISYYNRLFKSANLPSTVLDGVCGIDNSTLTVNLMVSVEKLLNAAVTARDSSGVPTEYTLPVAFESGPLAGASATSDPASSVMSADEVRPRFAETAAPVAYEDIRITTAVPKDMFAEAHPAVIGTPTFVSRFGVKVCTRLEVDGSNIQIYELVFDQTGCEDLGAGETTPIVFSGASCVASEVYNITVVDSSTAVGVLGADASFYRFSPTINSSAFRVYNVKFEYTTQTYQAGRNIVAVLGRATGTVEISGQCRLDSAPATTSPLGGDYFEAIGSGCWAKIDFDNVNDNDVPGLCVGPHSCLAPGYPGGCCTGQTPTPNLHCPFGFSCGNAAGSEQEFGNVGCRLSQCGSGQAHVVDVAVGLSNISSSVTYAPSSPSNLDNPVPNTLGNTLHLCIRDAPGLCSPRCTSGYSDNMLLPSGFQFETDEATTEPGTDQSHVVTDHLYGALQQWQRHQSTGEIGLGRFRISVNKKTGPTNERINLDDLTVLVQTDVADGPKTIVRDDGGPAVIDMSESDSRGYVHGINAFVNTTLLLKNFVCLDVDHGDRTMVVPNLCNETILRFRIDKSNNHVHPYLVNETVTGSMVGQGDRGRCLTSFLKTPRILNSSNHLDPSASVMNARLYVMPCEPCAVGDAFGGLGDVFIADEAGEQTIETSSGVWIYAGDEYYPLGSNTSTPINATDKTNFDFVLRFGKYNFLTLLIKILHNDSFACYFADDSHRPCTYSSALNTQRFVSTDGISIYHKMYLDNLAWMYFGGSPLMRLGITEREKEVCDDFDGPFFVQNPQQVGTGAIVDRLPDGSFQVLRGGGGFLSGLEVQLYEIPRGLFEIVPTGSFAAKDIASQFYRDVELALTGSSSVCSAVAVTQSVLIQPVNETTSGVVGSAINLINVSQWTSYFSAAYEKGIYAEPTSYKVLYVVSNIVVGIANAMLVLLHFVFVVYGVDLRQQALEKTKID